MADNQVTLVGNLTREPELRFTNGGRAIASFGLAVSRRYQTNGEWQEQTSFFNVVVWGQLGENVAQSCTKGTRLMVSGRLEQRSYEPRDGGEKRTIVEVVADEVGPSLKWATCQIERTQRSTEDGYGAGRGRSGGKPASDDQSYNYGDEEPF
jgi:single-strand DNA-binding protein